MSGEKQSRAKQLARDKNILDRFIEDLRKCGFVGEERAAKLVYLALTSRVFSRPISLLVKGPAGAGKSYLVNTAAKFFPEKSYRWLTAMSEKAIVYWDEDLRNRILIVGEAAGLQGEKGNNLVRSLLSEGRIKYAVAQRMGDEFVTRYIDKEGPTGLILTTTSVRLHEEDESRMLSITVADSPTQISQVLLAMDEETVDIIDLADLRSWHVLHAFVASGKPKVSIPFRKTLAAMVFSTSNRIKRDHMHVLTLIRSHALLHKVSRQLDERGHIEATMDDYEAVWEIVNETISEGVQSTVPLQIRETVKAVTEIDPKAVGGIACLSYGVNSVQIANKLGVHRTTAWRRMQDAIQLGYLENLETSSRKEIRVVVGNPMPEDQHVLPHPDALREAWEKSLAPGEAA